MKKSIASSIICALLTIPSISFAEDVAAEEKEKEETAGWFRLDSDALGLQLWAGAVHSVGPVDIASNIYVNSESFGELDIGPAFSFGPVSLLPMEMPMVPVSIIWAGVYSAITHHLQSPTA